MQIIHLILDKILKLSTYYMPFYRQSLQSYAISKTVQFFGPPCIKKFFCLRLSLPFSELSLVGSALDVVD